MLRPLRTSELLDRLRAELADRGCAVVSGGERAVVGTGVPALDAALPFGGLHRGSLVEWVDEPAGGGATTLAVLATREACRERGVAVLVDPERELYPPALAAWGLALDRLVVVHPATAADALWAADQALRSGAAGAVWLRPGRLRLPEARRLRLAAADGAAVGMLFRPERARGQPAWADLQLTVAPHPAGRGRRLRVVVTRCRGGAAGRAIDVEFDDATGVVRHDPDPRTVPGPAPLANPAAAG